MAGCAGPEVDSGSRQGLTTAEAERIKELERENKELRRANEILKAASALSIRHCDTSHFDDRREECCGGEGEAGVFGKRAA